MTAADAVREVARVVSGYRYAYADESALQDGIAQSLAAHGLPVEREVAVARGRIDLVVTCGLASVGVEVKVGGSPGEVNRQLVRYAACPEIDGLVLVTSRTRHVKVAVAGKPFAVVALSHGL